MMKYGFSGICAKNIIKHGDKLIVMNIMRRVSLFITIPHALQWPFLSASPLYFQELQDNIRYIITPPKVFLTCLLLVWKAFGGFVCEALKVYIQKNCGSVWLVLR